MKVSLITITIDPDTILRHTLESVAAQTYPDIEHIVIDSYADKRDEVLEHDFPKSLFIHTQPHGVYAAINEGLKHATGDIIGLIHGNDRLARPDVISDVVSAFENDPGLGFVFGDLQYYNPRTGRKGAIYASADYHPRMLRSLFTPPHPTLYLRHSVARRVGPYTTRYEIIGDIDMWMRLFALPGVRWKHLPGIMVEMSTGGMSGRLSNVIWESNREKLRLMQHYGIRGGVFTLLRKYFYAVRRFFIRY